MTIVVVTGLPRSGTSLMMQMLAAGGMPVLTDGVRSADADNPHGYYEFERVKQLRRDAAWLDEAEGKVVKIIYALLYDLPASRHYRVILMKRRIEEVLASQAVMLARRGAEGGDGDPARLAATFTAQIERAERWLAAQPFVALLPVEHGEAIGDPRRIAGLVGEFVGGGLDAVAMAAAVDPVLHRQRR